MQLALSLALRGQGRVEPNPMVGAVIVKNNRIIAQGYHHYFGGPHAEVDALRHAGPRAKDATLYVTLEPCCHFGKTPPCTDAILAAGLARVVVAMPDPFAQVHGKGLRILRSHGLQVDTGLLKKEAQALNAPFIKRISAKKPFVIAKWAQSLDGAIATSSGQSKWISSEPSRQQVQIIRGRVDAIIVGLRTALTDDPLLTARPKNSRHLCRIATRIVMDSTCHLPLTSQLVRTVSAAPVMVVHLPHLNVAAERRRRALAAAGVITLPIPQTPSSIPHSPRPSIPALLTYLASRDYTNILLEGGPTLLTSFLAAKQIDQFHIFLAPILIPGQPSPRPLAGPPLPKLPAAPHLTITSLRRSGPDLYLIATCS